MFARKPSTRNMEHKSIATTPLARFYWVVALCLPAVPILPPVSAFDEIRTFQPTKIHPLRPHFCPRRCDLLFARLEDGPQGGLGARVQHVEVQERGEPKSGTGFMFEWATGALAYSCIYLQKAYGRKSCRIEWNSYNRTLIFDPSLAALERREPPCSCNNVERVTVRLFNSFKHALPVAADCAYSREGSIEDNTRSDGVCRPPSRKGRSANRSELWRCVEQAGCPILDDRLQMAVMRDPREVVMDAYFHILKHINSVPEGLGNADQYALRMLPTAAKWTSVRHVLFGSILEKNSAMFWYDEALAYPRNWHYRFLSFVGLDVPREVVHEAAESATTGGRILVFPTSSSLNKSLDLNRQHRGGEDTTGTTVSSMDRSFRVELEAATLVRMEEVLRMWLHPDLLERFGVSSR